MQFTRLSRRPALALLTVTGLAALALPAGAAPRATTAPEGAATSSITVLRLTVSGTTVTAGRIAAVASNKSSPHTAKLVVTPLDSTVTGPVGQQTITPSSSPATVPSTPKSVSLPAGLGSVTGPTFSVKAADNATSVLTSAVLKALGKVTLVTVPLSLKAATLSDIAKVTATQASAKKTLALGSLSLPSLQDLLAALGVDLDALLNQLTQGKLTQLAGLVGSTAKGAVKTANDAVDAAQAAVGGTVPKTLDSAQNALSGANTDLTQANTALTAANTAFTTSYDAIPDAGLTALGVPVSLTADQFTALAPALQSAVDALSADDLAALSAAVTAAEGVVQAAQDAVDQLQALVTALTDLIASVLDAVTSNSDPLAALGDVKVTTAAVAAATPKANADVSVGSVSVLGALVPLADLTSALGDVMTTLSGVLESVAGVSFTPASVAVGKATKSTSTKGTTRFARASVTALTVKLPSIELPAALTLPGAPTGISGSLKLGAVTETAQWTPGTTSTPGSPQTGQPTGGSPLPDTGGGLLLPVAGLLILGGALALRRRMRVDGPEDNAA